jgi:hypothetical protein
MFAKPRSTIGYQFKPTITMSTSQNANWFEPLPSQCPPESAKPPNGVFYRLAKSATVVCEDFWSARKLTPSAVFHANECIAMAVSVHSDPSPLAELKKLARHQEKAVVAVTLIGETAGLIEKTGKCKHHHSWWRPSDFPVLEHLCSTPK